MAQIAELKIGNGEPTIEISVTQDNGLPRARYQVILYDSNGRNPVLVGSNKKLASPTGSHRFPIPLSQLDDCWLWFQASIGGPEALPQRWELRLKILQNGQVVDGGNFIKGSTFDSFGQIYDQVRLNVT